MTNLDRLLQKEPRAHLPTAPDLAQKKAQVAAALTSAGVSEFSFWLGKVHYEIKYDTHTVAFYTLGSHWQALVEAPGMREHLCDYLLTE